MARTKCKSIPLFITNQISINSNKKKQNKTSLLSIFKQHILILCSLSKNDYQDNILCFASCLLSYIVIRVLAMCHSCKSIFTYSYYSYFKLTFLPPMGSVSLTCICNFLVFLLSSICVCANE